jgi:hypothetical protein
MERFVSIFLYRVMDEYDPLNKNQWRRTDAMIYDDLRYGKSSVRYLIAYIVFHCILFVQRELTRRAGKERY